MGRLIKEAVIRGQSVEGKEVQDKGEDIPVSIPAAYLNQFEKIDAYLYLDGVMVRFYSVIKCGFVMSVNPAIELVSVGSDQGFIDELQKLIAQKIRVCDRRK